MANFSPANRAKILLRLHDELQPGLKYYASAKYEIAREQSQENQNGAENTNRENGCIVLSQFFQLLGMVTAYNG